MLIQSVFASREPSMQGSKDKCQIPPSRSPLKLAQMWDLAASCYTAGKRKRDKGERKDGIGCGGGG